MKLKTEVLKKVVGHTSFLVDDVVLAFEDDGLSVRVVDPSHVAMLSLFIPKDDFEEYEAVGSVAVELPKVKEVLAIAKKEAIVDITHDAEKNRLVFTLGNIQRRMALLDINSMGAPQKVPDIDYDKPSLVEQAELKKALEAIAYVTDHLTIKVRGGKIIITAEGKGDEMRVELGGEAGAEARAMYPLGYILPAVKTMSGKISVFLKDDYPITLEGENVKYMIAPRIED